MLKTVSSENIANIVQIVLPWIQSIWFRFESEKPVMLCEWIEYLGRESPLT